MPDHLDTVAYFAAYSAHQLDIPTTSSPLLSSECASSIYASSVIHLDTIIKKWWVVKGPFVHAKAKEIFEMKRHRRLVQVFDAHEDLVNEWIEYVNRNLPAGVDMKAEVFQHASPSNLLASLKAQKQAKETATANEEGHLHEDLKSSATSSSSSTLKTFDQKVKARTSELLKLLEKKVSNRKRPSK